MLLIPFLLICSSFPMGLCNDEEDSEEGEVPISPMEHIYDINSHFENPDLVYGDVLLSPSQKRAREMLKHGLVRMAAVIKSSGSNRWPGNTVPYELSNSYSASERSSINSAISALQSKTCFKFPQKSSKHKNYLYIDKKDGCYSFVGKRSGRQLVSLGNGCLSQGTIQHEIMHALGIEHEHQRPDRDQHIQVKYENVEPRMKDNFEKVPYSRVDLHGLPYDFASVMHYDAKAFGKTDPKSGSKLTTMFPKKKSIVLRDNTQLSAQDLKKLNILGNCNKAGSGKSKGKGKKSGGKIKKMAE